MKSPRISTVTLFLVLFLLSACSTAATFAFVNNSGFDVTFEDDDGELVELATGETSEPITLSWFDDGVVINTNECSYAYSDFDLISFARQNPPSEDRVRVRYEVRVAADLTLNIYKIFLRETDPVEVKQTGGGFPAQATKTCN